jgi:hypothetical protein
MVRGCGSAACGTEEGEEPASMPNTMVSFKGTRLKGWPALVPLTSSEVRRDDHPRPGQPGRS